MQLDSDIVVTNNATPLTISEEVMCLSLTWGPYVLRVSYNLKMCPWRQVSEKFSIIQVFIFCVHLFTRTKDFDNVMHTALSYQVTS